MNKYFKFFSDVCFAFFFFLENPVLIGGAIELPFLTVLFGILGGVETLGLLSLFLEPSDGIVYS